MDEEGAALISCFAPFCLTSRVPSIQGKGANQGKQKKTREQATIAERKQNMSQMKEKKKKKETEKKRKNTMKLFCLFFSLLCLE
jgi:hypothetical protein